MGQAAGSREPGAPDGQSRRIAAQRRGILPPHGRVLSVACLEEAPGEPSKINQSITFNKTACDSRLHNYAASCCAA